MRFRYNFRNLPTFLRGQTMTLLYCNYLKLLSEAVAPRCSVKKVFLNISQNSQENTCARVSLLITLLNFVKRETLAQVSSVKFVKFLRTLFFTKHLRQLLLFFSLWRKYFFYLRLSFYLCLYSKELSFIPQKFCYCVLFFPYFY